MKLINLKDISSEPVSHDPEILKQVMIGAGAIPNLSMFSKATIKAGQSVSQHRHDNIYEILFFISGKGEAVVDGNRIKIMPNQCLVIEPRETHSVPAVSVDIELVYFGIHKQGENDRDQS